MSKSRSGALALFQYSAIPWATIMGWLVWRDTPTPPIAPGNCIIVGSGLFVYAGGRFFAPAKGVIGAPRWLEWRRAPA